MSRFPCLASRENLYCSIGPTIQRKDIHYSLFSIEQILSLSFLESGAERCFKEIVNLLHWDNFDIEKVLNRLRSVTSCTELVQENCSQILANKRFLKKEVQIEQKGSSYESILYRKKVIEVLKGQTEMCLSEERMRF